MKSIAGTPAEVEAARVAISAARGYPKRGQVFRRDGQGELVQVTGDLRYDVGTVATYAPEITTSDDKTLAAFDVDTGVLVVPPEVASKLVEASALPAKILAVRELQPPEMASLSKG